MTDKITQNQIFEIDYVIMEAVITADLTTDDATEILKNTDILQREVTVTLKKLAVSDKNFGPVIADFTITVPADYNHDTWIDEFADKTKGLETTHYYNEALISENFTNATTRLEPGKMYRVRIFPLLTTVTSEDCMKFLRQQRAIFVGTHGLMLVQDLIHNGIPIEKWPVSFDKKDALWTDQDNNLRVAFMRHYKDHGWRFSLGCYDDDLISNFCLLCFSDI
jgi:hypothetical protein